MIILSALKICIGLAILAVLLAGVAGFVVSSRISREEEKRLESVRVEGG